LVSESPRILFHDFAIRAAPTIPPTSSFTPFPPLVFSPFLDGLCSQTSFSKPGQTFPFNQLPGIPPLCLWPPGRFSCTLVISTLLSDRAPSLVSLSGCLTRYRLFLAPEGTFRATFFLRYGFSFRGRPSRARAFLLLGLHCGL